MSGNAEIIWKSSSSWNELECPITEIPLRQFLRKRRRKEVEEQRKVDYPSNSSDEEPPRKVRRKAPRPKRRDEPERNVERENRMHLWRNRRLFARKCEDFVDCVVPRFSDAQFKMHFRVNRSTLSVLQDCFVIGVDEENLVEIEKRANIRLSDYMLMFLWFVGNGKTFDELSETFDVDYDDAVYVIDIVLIFFHVFGKQVIRFPQTRGDAKRHAAWYRKVFNFPDTIGCLTNHKIEMRYRDRAWIQTITDARGKFLHVHVNYWTELHPRDMLEESPIGGSLQDLCYRKFHLMADENYYVRHWLLTPFENAEAVNEILFNTKHKVIMDKAYKDWDDLVYRFRYLGKALLQSNEVEGMVKACCILQNICVDEDDYFPFMSPNPNQTSPRKAEAVHVVKDNPDLRSFGLLKRRQISHNILC